MKLKHVFMNYKQLIFTICTYNMKKFHCNFLIVVFVSPTFTIWLLIFRASSMMFSRIMIIIKWLKY